MDEVLVGPVAALGLALLVLGLFYTGKILSRSTVPREDFEALKEINASYAAALPVLTAAVNNLVVVVQAQQRQNGVR